jgi:hypothetical protein
MGPAVGADPLDAHEHCFRIIGQLTPPRHEKSADSIGLLPPVLHYIAVLPPRFCKNGRIQKEPDGTVKDGAHLT